MRDTETAGTKPKMVGRPFPRGPLYGAGALVALSLFAAVFLQPDRGAMQNAAAGPDAGAVENATVVSTRNLRFEDQADGAVAVFDADEATLVTVLPPGSNGFLRAALRGFARDHKLEAGAAGVTGPAAAATGPSPPFRLTLWSDGRLSLEDLMTRRATELTAFGHTNAEAFARLLPPRTATP